MDEDAQLLVIWHSRTCASKKMAEAAATHNRAKLIAADEVQATDLIKASAYLFAAPENLGSLSGSMKEMFDRNYYPVLGKIEGRPYASIIAAGSDGEGAQTQLDRIVTGWRLKRVAEPMIVNFDAQSPEEILAIKTPSPQTLLRCEELGTTLCEGVSLGLF